MRITIAPDQMAEIIRLYVDEERTFDEIGTRVGFCGSAIRKALLRHEIPLRTVHKHLFRNFTEAQLQDIVESYSKGSTVREIAARYQSTITTISKTLRERGVEPLRAPQRRHAELAKLDVVAEYEAGSTMSEISKRHGISHPILKEMLFANGAVFRPTSDYLTGRLFSVDEIQTIKAQYLDDYSVERLARLYHVCERKISSLLESVGVNVKDYQYSRPNSDEKLEIVQLYRQGMTIDKIGEEVGFSYLPVRKALIEAGVEIRINLQTSSTRYGYTGVYKHHVFRSLMELCFILDNEERHDIQTAETRFKIRYTFEGREHTYHPDFVLDGTRIVEIKPSQFHQDPKIIAKSDAMRVYCKTHGLTFEIVEWPIYKCRVKSLILNGEVRILNRTIEQVHKHLGICLEKEAA